MLRVYTYTAQDLGLAELPQGLIRLDEYEPATPGDADVILCPVITFNLNRFGIDLRKLPLMACWPRKHVFADIADSRGEAHEFFPGVESIFLRAALTTEHVRVNPRSRAFAWPVWANGAFDDWDRPPAGGTPAYACSLHAFDSCSVRSQVAASCRQILGERADIRLYPDFTGAIYDTEEGKRRRGLYRESLRNSLVALCPRSIPGNPAYRLYEAMAAGRLPLHFCDGCVLPFPSKIDWERVCIRLPESSATQAGEIVRDLVAVHGAQELLARGRDARRAWEDYLDDRYMPRHHRMIVEEMLAENL